MAAARKVLQTVEGLEVRKPNTAPGSLLECISREKHGAPGERRGLCMHRQIQSHM